MRILIVEAERQLSEAVTHTLQKHNYTVDAVYDGKDGYHYIRSDIYDIVILDETLPSMNGYEILQKIREEGMTTTILMLTAPSHEPDKIEGLDHGADDYVTKPFVMEELLARLRALCRRKDKSFEQDIITIGDMEFNHHTEELYNDHRSVHLTHLESQLFQLFVSRQNTFTSKNEIIASLWGNESDIKDNNVEVYVSFLRKKIRYISSRVSIKTTRNVGYSLVVTDSI